MQIPLFKEYNSKTLLSETNSSVVIRAFRKTDNKSVIIKTLPFTDKPGFSDIARIKGEFETLKYLNRRSVPGVPKVYKLKKHRNLLVIEMEDIQAKSLNILMDSKPFNIKKFLQAAIQIVSILKAVHDCNVIHKDINPSNIILNNETGNLNLIDFSCAQKNDNVKVRHDSLKSVEGTLAYISPEQTGRMNMNLDHRSDFYSLGVTFYQMVTGRLPFETNNPQDYLHFHIAREALPAHKVYIGIPIIISKIISKLMSKSPAGRYQSAEGLKADLKKCLSNIQLFGRLKTFSLGANDIIKNLNLPTKLYGREQELESLANCFKMALPGKSVFTVINGQSGIGIKSLVNEIHKTITKYHSYFISGKFDRGSQDTPFSAIIEAFRSLFRQFLTEPEDKLQKIKTRLKQVIDPYGAFFLRFIPELELLAGPEFKNKYTIPPKGDPCIQNQILKIIISVINLIASDKQPLVIFLDDLQWADAASFRLLQGLLTAPKPSQLFIIAAYRKEQYHKEPLLSQLLNKLEQHKIDVCQIRLSALNQSDINSLICESLGCSRKKGIELAKLVFEKTYGIPFYLLEFIKSLRDRNLIYFDSTNKKWKWVFDEIKASAISENMSDLVSRKITSLDLQLQKLMTKASFLGCSFDKHILSIVSEAEIKNIDDCLDKAVSAGLIIPVRNNGHRIKSADSTLLACGNYRFSHEKIRTAAYNLVPEKDRKLRHWQIGSLIVKHARKHLLDKYIFIIVNQLNIGFSCLIARQEIQKLARLNLIAARQANKKAAYASAISFFKKAIELLGPGHWKTNYRLSLELYNEAAVSALTEHDFSFLENLLIPAILQNAKSVIDKITVYQISLQFFNTKGKYEETIKNGAAFLKDFDIEFPETISKHHVFKEMTRLRWKLFGRKSSGILKLAQMKSEYHLAAMRILAEYMVAAFSIKHKSLHLVIARIIYITLKYGLCSYSAYGVGGLGAILCSSLNSISAGQKYGYLALDIAKHFQDRKSINFISFYVDSSIFSWRTPIKEQIDILKHACRKAVEEGDALCARHAARMYCYVTLASGMALQQFLQKIPYLKHSVGCINSNKEFHEINIVQQTMENLTSSGHEVTVLKGDHFDEVQFLEPGLSQYRPKTIFCFSFMKLILCYWFGDLKNAEKYNAIAQKHADCILGTPLVIQFLFYNCLVLIALADNGAPAANRRQFIRKVESNCKRLRKFAEQVPMLFLSKYFLTKAELFRIKSRPMHEVLPHYKNAILYARQYELKHEEALAKELLGQYFEKTGDHIAAAGYYREAQYCYGLWGARSKIEHLGKRMLTFCLDKTEANLSVQNSCFVNSSYKEFKTTEQQLEVTSLNKTLISFAEENDYQKLANSLLKSLMTSAGAQKGSILQIAANQFQLEAHEGIESVKDVTEQNVAITRAVPVPESILNFVARTKTALILHHAARDERFCNDPYISKNRTKSVLCIPMQYPRQPLRIVYLENNLLVGVFAEERLPMLLLLISISGAHLEASLLSNLVEKQNRSMEKLVEQRTLQLSRVNNELKKLLEDREQDTMTLLKNSPNAVYIKDENARFLWANEKFTQLYGLSESAITGKTSAEIFNDQNCAKSELFDIQVLTDKRALQYEERIWDKGEQRIFMSLKFPIFKDAREPIRLGGFLIDITKEKKAQQQIRQLSANLIENQEKERAAIARELHDELGQVLTILSMDAEWVTKKLENAQVQDIQRADKMSELISQTLDNVRDLAIRLRPRILDDLGIIKALEWYTDEFQQRTGIECEFCCNILSCPEGTAATTIYRITQEALTNIARHSGSTRADVRLSSKGPMLELAIEDDGKGFDIESLQSGSIPKGLGLDGMRERAELAGGFFKIESEPGMGTRLSFELPILDHEKNTMEVV
ncbi:MAG: AAA family ATPase [Desulfobacteraceae bacterium]|nr:AAA family ATPase [Desulfobacteraceae bacterium]